MNMAVAQSVFGKVFIFNVTATPIYLVINNGPTRSQLGPATTVFGLVPTGLRPQPILYDSPAPDSLGLGTNHLDITPMSSGETATVKIDIPSRVIRGDALQIYLSSASTKTDMWMMLRNGKPLAGNVHPYLPSQQTVQPKRKTNDF